MPKLSIINAQGYFTREEIERLNLRLIRPGGGTGYRFMLAESPSQYIARARLKGQDYPEGQYESELRFTRVGQLEQWEDSLIVEGRQAH